MTTDKTVYRIAKAIVWLESLKYEINKRRLEQAAKSIQAKPLGIDYIERVIVRESDGVIISRERLLVPSGIPMRSEYSHGTTDDWYFQRGSR